MDGETFKLFITTPFVESWFGQARGGDLYDGVIEHRSAAWLHWVLNHANAHTGYMDRPYFSIDLDGVFANSNISGKFFTKPHLELPEWFLAKPDPYFGNKISQVGNTLENPQWTVDETKTLKRTLSHSYGNPQKAAKHVETYRKELNSVFYTMSNRVMAQTKTASMYINNPGNAQEIFGDITPNEINTLIPNTPALKASVDTKLFDRLKSRNHTSKGIWVLSSQSSKNPYMLPVLTPDLSTVGNYIKGFKNESGLAMLVRAVVLRRILAGINADMTGLKIGVDETQQSGYFKALSAKMGHKTPDPSKKTLENFVTDYPDGQKAYSALNNWLETSKYIKQNDSKETFLKQHQNIKNSKPVANQILLPLVLDAGKNLYRVTYVKLPEK